MNRYFALFAIAALSVNGQISVSNRTDLGAVDESGAVSTKPMKVGSSLPATCSVGEQFYLTSATAGQNLYGCTATNTWTAQAGSPSITSTAIKNANSFTTGGVGTAYTGCPTSAPASLVAYQVYLVTFNTASTSTTPTLNICALGAKTLVHSDSSALASGEVGTGGYCTAFYDGTNVQIYGTCLTGPGRILVTAGTAPSTPASGVGAVYVDSTSKNLAIKNDAGLVNHGVQTKTVVSNNVISAIADDGSSTQVNVNTLTAGITNGLKSASTTVDVSAATAPSVGQVLTATDSTHATWQAAAAAGYRDWQKGTGAVAMTGSPVAVYTSSNVTLAAGYCLSIEWGITAGTSSQTVEFYMDAVLIATPFGSGGSTLEAGALRYCNNPGTQAAQTTFYSVPTVYYGGSGNVLTTGVANTEAQSHAPSAVNFASGSHTLTLKVTQTNATTVQGDHWLVVTL